MSTIAIIVAAGRSERFGDKLPKQFHDVAGKPLLTWTISAFEKAGEINQITIVTSSEYLSYVTERVIDPYKFIKVSKVIEGGSNRKESVQKGLESLSKSTKIVAIHDGVRPLVLSGDIDMVVAAAKSNRAAILAIQSKDTVKEVENETILKTLDRSKIWLAQTPQAFEYSLILEAHKKSDKSEKITDDSLLIETLGVKVKVVEPSSSNIKVTTPEDLSYVESVLRKKTNA